VFTPSLCLKNSETFKFSALVGQFWNFPDLSPPDRLTLRIYDLQVSKGLGARRHLLRLESLHDYAMEEVLVGPHFMLTTFDPKRIQKLVAHLRPNNVLVSIASRGFEGGLFRFGTALLVCHFGNISLYFIYLYIFDKFEYSISGWF